MTINALNSGAKVWLADFEDANTPLWENMVGGQLNLRDALDRTIDFEPGGKTYTLKADEELATIVVRPRGWHLDEKHVLVDGERMSGSLFDFGLYFFHCARRQLDKGKGPYFYLPKIESHLEARLWNDVFNLAQDVLDIPRGTIRATVLDRDHPGGVRDGGDPLRAARPLGGPQRRPLGLPVLRDQEVPDTRPAVPAARAQRGDDDGAVHARVHRAARAHLPQARRARDRRHGGVHPVPPRRRGQQDRAREGPRGQDPRVRRRLRRLMGRPPRPGADLPRGLRRRARRQAEPARPHARGGVGVRRGPARRRARPRARSPRPGCATTSASACSTSPPGWAARRGRRSST